MTAAVDAPPLRLTADELHDITGYKQPALQCEYIRAKYGIYAHVNAANVAIVIRAHLDAAAAPAQNPRSKPPIRRVV